MILTYEYFLCRGDDRSELITDLSYAKAAARPFAFFDNQRQVFALIRSADCRPVARRRSYRRNSAAREQYDPRHHSPYSGPSRAAVMGGILRSAA